MKVHGSSSSLLILALAGIACSLPEGPLLSPQANFDYVCNALRPNPLSSHGAGTAGNGGYSLEIAPPMMPITNGFTYEANTTYSITIVNGGIIQGFLVQARLPDDAPVLGTAGMLLGSFQPGSEDHQIYNCTDLAGAANEATITHSARQSANMVQFTWTSPTTSGDVDFYYTVVRQTVTHFDAISASQVGVVFATLPPPTTAGPTVATTATPPPTTGPATPPTTAPAAPLTTAPPGNTVAPIRAPEDYRLQVLNPEGCVRSECDLFIGIDTNTGDSGFLDIYMEGTAEGWLAVGFSETPNMFSADVVGCNRLGDSIVVIDSWNPASPARASNTDMIQDVTLFSASFDSDNTRLYCTVAKRIAPSTPPGSDIVEDLDLNNDLFVIFARRVTPSNALNALGSHAIDGPAVRGASAAQFSIATGAGAVGGNVFDTVHRPNLIRAHGILMIIAWPLLAITAIFFALFMRPALPNGEWFQVHRALLMSSLIIGAVAFILIFVALVNSGGLVDITSNTSLTHLILGVIVMALHIVNPIIAIFRCHPGKKNRWIFNLLHGSLVGFVAEILSLINVAIGVYIFSNNLSRFRLVREPFWVFVSWDVFYVLLVLSLFTLFTVIAIVKKKKGLAPSAVQALLRTDEGEKKPEPVGINLDHAVKGTLEKTAPKRKTPSKDAPLRWAALVVYLAVTVPILLAVIVMIALPQ